MAPPTDPGRLRALAALNEEIVACRRCPRLVAWRERVAAERVARFADQTYWGRPVPGFGDPAARILVLGLAPAAHGGNRTGRVFTGDRSGDFLYAALHRAGLASQPTSVALDDGLVLAGAYVAAVVRCAPPGNRPRPEELEACLPYAARELVALEDVRVIVALGAIAWTQAMRLVGPPPGAGGGRRPRFGHGAEAALGRYRLLGSYHPSQQNTFTGRLTPEMLDEVIERAIALARIG